MTKTFYTLLIALCSGIIATAQKAAKNENGQKSGIKAGYNWSYLTGNNEGIKPENKSGFMVSGFYGTSGPGKGYRTELVFSRQGYSFDDGGKNTDVMNDYIYLPQLATFGIGKFAQLQAGGQIGFLLKSKMTTNSKDSTITDLMNRVDYGFAGGLEIYPFKGLILGGRYNLGLGKLHKRYEQMATNPYPLPFNPETTDFKNGLVQFFVGYRF